MFSRLILVLALVASVGGPVQSRVPDPTTVTYLTPIWPMFVHASETELATQASLLKSRIGSNAHVRLGFATYIEVLLPDWNVNLASQAALRAALAPLESQVDDAIRRAQRHDVVLVITLLTRIRERVDPAQTVSFAEDRRVMQWYADNSVATGWWSLSRYARRQYAVREAYMREAGRILAEKMAASPDTLVAVAGDGEVELSINRMDEPSGPVVADYSPFAIAEFRDWIRGAGLYAAGQPYAGQGWTQAARYTDDLSPGADTNGDGHTLNGDYNTSFDTWALRHFDWSLSDNEVLDPKRIPAALYGVPGFNAVPDSLPSGFDAPRTINAGDGWWQLWARFRETMVWRHNLDIARWMTASVPADRWYSYQIPADYLFGYTPANPDRRLVASASPWWTANVHPHGGLGFTSFATHQGGGVYARTLPGLLGAARPCAAGEAPPTCVDAPGGLASVPWGIFEWNPAVPGTNDPAVYLDEIRRLRRYRPRVLAPYAWGYADHPVLDSGFEPALRQLVSYLENGWAPSVSTTPSAVQFGATLSNGAVTQLSGPQTIVVGQPTGGTVDWTATTTSGWLTITGGQGHGDGSFQVGLSATAVAALPAGVYTGTVSVAAPGSVEGTRTVAVSLTVVSAATSARPFGSFDTPVHESIVQGSIVVTGWALDDIEIDRVEIWRDRVSNDPAPPFLQDGHPANGKVFIANGTFVDGTRPDVADLYASAPYAHRAGWGYMLLTWGFPNANGTFVLTAIAWDKDRQHTVLGTKRITVDNAASKKPFGSIDVPAYGATFSGHNWTYGWALTPNADCTMSGGQVYMTIDSAPPNFAVNYGAYRTDIAAAFPGFSDSSGAGGAVALNSSNYPSGTHQIGWLVYDSCGNGEGIGSRFFTILNEGARLLMRASAPDSRAPEPPPLVDTPASSALLWLVRGMGTIEMPLEAGSPVSLSQTGRIEVHVTRPGVAPMEELRYEAHQMINGVARALPRGSSFDPARGSFYWQPVPGFLGTYRIRITQLRAGVPDVHWEVPVNVGPDTELRRAR